MSQLSGPQLRALKARAQRLEPILKIGKAGLSDAFFAALETALDQHELVKLKFESFKDQKKSSPRNSSNAPAANSSSAWATLPSFTAADPTPPRMTPR